jgi:hypothetical protein
MDNELNNSSDYDSNEMSFSDKVANLFAEPSNLFEYIKLYPPKTIDWLIPVIITIILTVFSSIMQMNDIEIKAEIKQKQIEALQKAVDDGRLPAENFEQAVENMEKFAGYQLFGTLIFVPISVFLLFFITALIYWAITKLILRGDSVLYGHILSIVGLISIIGIFSIIVTLVLSIMYGKMNIGLNLALIAPTTTGPILLILKAIDPFTIWSLILTSIGLAKLSSSSFQKSVISVFGFAIILLLLSILTSNLFPSLSM